MAALKVGDPFDEKTELGATVNGGCLADLDRDVRRRSSRGEV